MNENTYVRSEYESDTLYIAGKRAFVLNKTGLDLYMYHLDQEHRDPTHFRDACRVISEYLSAQEQTYRLTSTNERPNATLVRYNDMDMLLTTDKRIKSTFLLNKTELGLFSCYLCVYAPDPLIHSQCCGIIADYLKMKAEEFMALANNSALTNN